MPICTKLFLPAIFCLLANQIFAQNVVITSQNPTQLHVCGQDGWEITVKNNTAAPLTGVQMTLNLPTGIEYVPASVVGATEFSLSNPSAPVFALIDVPVGATMVISGQEKATCDVAAAINSGQLFTNQVNLTYSGGNQSYTTLNYPVEIGLLTIIGVSPATMTGQNGQVLTRTITVKNSRQGAISSLQFSDQHFPGISIQLAGVSGTPTGTVYNATVPGSYFTAFGDGDDLLEYNETVTLTEQITVEDCGIPSYSNPSTIKVGWGCENTVCQGDQTTAEVTILPSVQNPMLTFVPIYTPQVSQCAGEGAVQEVLIINTGPVQAQDVNVSLITSDTARLGLDYNSVAYQAGSGWLPLTPISGLQQELAACGLTFYSKLTLTIPLVPPGDTVRLRFSTFFCQPLCGKGEPGVSGFFQYANNCPNAPAQNGSFSLQGDSTEMALRSKIYFDIGDCIADNTVHTFTYWVKSGRLLNNSGYVQLEMELPWGLFWQNNCIPTLDGKTPVSIQVDTVANVSTTLHLAFQLPMTQDSVYGEFCLLNICQDVSAYPPAIPNPPPSGSSFTVYPVQPPCSPCIQKINAVTFISTELDVTSFCGISVCDSYELVLDCGCGDHSCVGMPSEGSLIIANYDAWRLNVGLRDDDDDRQPDDGSLADPSLIRRDRFLPGDTMRTQLRGVVAQGNVAALGFRIFHESWESDFGIDGGNDFQIPAGQFLFTNADDFQYLNGSVLLKIAATGASYECPVNFAFQVDRNYLRIAVPNIRPEQVYDQLITMFHQFNISLVDLAGTGCVPPGLLLQAGDSLIFHGDFVFKQNFVPPSPSVPPLINFRNTICGTDHIFAWQLAGCFPPLLRQYSGYVENMRPPVYSILPCANSTEIFPFKYSMWIARGNLFPYEVRPLATLSNYQHTLPVVNLLESRLNFLRLQENTVVFNNQLLPVIQANNQMQLDLDPFFDPPLDEGFLLEISSLFGPSCEFAGPVQTSTEFQIRYPNAGFHTPIIQQAKLSNLNGYNSGAPQLTLETAATTINITTDQLEIDFKMRNQTPTAAPNAWMTINTNGNNLSNLALVFQPSGQTIPLIAGLYQLGSISGFSVPQLQLRGQLDACEPVDLVLNYGWDCDPVNNLSGPICGTYSLTIHLVPQSPEIELVLVDQPESLTMCTPSDFFVFEIYNAAKGRAYSPVGSIKLPPGLSVLPGSSQISSPTGASWTFLSDPAELAGNVYEWEPPVPDGLFPFAEAPKNGFQIRFRVIAACGFVANSQPIYGADCRKPCGVASNKLRKPGQPIQLEGLEPNYLVDAQLTLADPNAQTSCGESTGLTAILNLGGAPMPGDSVYVLLPAGVSFVAGSYQPGPNAPAGPPQVTSEGLQLALPPGLAAGSELRFTFSVRYDDAAGCSDQAVLLQTREKSQAFCVLTNQNCTVYVATGEAILFLKTANPDLLIKNFVTSVVGNGVSFNALLENAGTGTAKNSKVIFFLDQNHNGKKDPNEPQVGVQQTSETIAPATFLAIAGNLSITAAQLCDLAVLLPADANCACADRVLSLGGQATIIQSIGLCELATVPLQVDSVAGSTYAWLTPQGLACASCTHTTYTPPANVQSGDLVTLILEEKTANCTIQHQFDLQFGGNLGVQTEDKIICEGEIVSLEATPGGSYVWSGPGITNTALATQILQPTQNATYAVTVTFAGSCTGTDQIAVTVLQKDSVDLGVVSTCIGQQVNVFGEPTDKPGIYTQILSKSNGCDSIVYIRLEITPTETSEVKPLCQGDSLMVFDSLFYQSGSLCKTFSSVAGCDSTHCVTVTAVPNPLIPAQDSIIIGVGEEITLNGPSGFANYIWLPATGLSCADCPNPLAQPDTTTTYLLTVADNNGCMGSVLYRVLVFPPCDPHRLLIPNAFTPNGDGVNDRFNVVPFEGLESVVELTIYDRWGEKVYVGSGTNAAWDGTIKGKPAPSDVYVYKLVVNCNGEKTPLTMEVTLLR